ncbi:hypothetical protein PC123_g13326 [Phytophthora cactorum]|nr:hypothetical protein PC123_g13326 [Phytophthora cactorum]
MAFLQEVQVLGVIQEIDAELIFSLPCVGQFFLDKDLISSVEAVTLYSTNKQSTKVNSRDNVFKEASGNGYDPNFQYSLVGDTVEDAVSTPTGSSATATTGDTNTALSATTFGGFAALLAAFTPMIFAIL